LRIPANKLLVMSFPPGRRTSPGSLNRVAAPCPFNWGNISARWTRYWLRANSTRPSARRRSRLLSSDVCIADCKDAFLKKCRHSMRFAASLSRSAGDVHVVGTGIRGRACVGAIEHPLRNTKTIACMVCNGRDHRRGSWANLSMLTVFLPSMCR
jgi:hypothetical protein